MLLVAIIAFIGVFVVVGGLLFVSSIGKARTEQTKAHLETALASNRPSAGLAADINFRKADVFSNIPWLNRWLLNMEIAPKLRVLLHQANLGWTTGGLLLGVAACTIVPGYLVYMRTDQILFGVLCGLICAYAPFGYVLYRRSQRFAAFEEQLPEALDLMVSGLRAGHSLVAALRLVAQESPDPIGTEFRLCFEEQNYGLELREALENMIARMPLQDLRIMATAVLIQKESGGNLAEVLEKPRPLSGSGSNSTAKCACIPHRGG